MSDTFVVFAQDGGSCEILEAKSAKDAAARVLADWDLVAEPGYKLYAVALKDCSVFPLVLSVGVGEGETE